MEAKSIMAAIRLAGDLVLGESHSLEKSEALDAIAAEGGNPAEVGDVLDVAGRLLAFADILKQVHRPG